MSETGTSTLIQKVLGCMESADTQWCCTEHEIKLCSIKHARLDVIASKTTLPLSYCGSFETRTSDAIKMMKECVVLSDLHVDTDEGVLRLLVGEGGDGNGLRIECRITPREFGVPPDITPESLIELHPGMLAMMGHEYLDSVEMKISGENRLTITGVGDIPVVSEQFHAEIHRGPPDLFFLLSGEAFRIVSRICELAPTRLLLSVESSISVFHFHFKEIVVVVYAQNLRV